MPKFGKRQRRDIERWDLFTYAVGSRVSQSTDKKKIVWLVVASLPNRGTSPPEKNNKCTSTVSSDLSKTLSHFCKFFRARTLRYRIRSFCRHYAGGVFLNVQRADFLHLFECLRETVGLLLLLIAPLNDSTRQHYRKKLGLLKRYVGLFS